MKNFLLVFVIALVGIGSALEVDKDADHLEEDHQGDDDHEHHDGVHLYSWRWSDIYYSANSTFSSPVLVSGLIIFKILFHHLSVLERLLPESCVLILVGTLFGVF